MTQLKYHKYQQDNLAKGFRVTQVDIVSCIYRKFYEERNRQQKLESTPKCHSNMPLYGSTPRLHSITPLHKLHSAILKYSRFTSAIYVYYIQCFKECACHVFICPTGLNLSPGVRKPTIWILSRSDTNQAVQPLKMARGLKFGI